MAEPIEFSTTVVQKLGYYVYRLIDPRNGETFYVGKGTGNRVFKHVKDELGADANALSEKLQRIRDIHHDGFEITHVIHRHGMDERTALEVEAALIDAYPEASNLVSGQRSDLYGLMHARQIIERYEAREAVFRHSVILINVGQSVTEKGSYEAVRYAWVLDPKRAAKAEYVLAVDRGLIIDVFVAEKWLEATAENFPGIAPDWPDWKGRRWGFVGRKAPEDVASLYRRCRLPDSMRKRGAANPIRYANKRGPLDDPDGDTP
ncbi:MAG: LEM-3-like GIY-YIG domain-containing protein [Acidobacteriaceae bacterium]